MGSYLDRLHAEYDELQTGITTILDRATEEDREVRDDEQTEVTRAEERQEVLQRSIDHYTAIEERNAKVNAARGRVTTSAPRQTRPKPDEPAYDIAREFPTPGHYAQMLHRAWVKNDPQAIEQLERATAHQTTAANPGLIPRPIVGPVIDTMKGVRRFVSSIPNRPGPGVPKFDRPRVDQHVDVGIQAAEKDETASQQLKVNPIPVALETFAGHLNISKQDLRWSQPSILDVIFSSFTRVYARRTEAKACADFVTGIAGTGAGIGANPGNAAAPIDAWTIAAIDEFLSDGLVTVEADTDVLVNTLWMSRDVWSRLRRVRTAMDQPAYNLPLSGGGDVAGLLPVVSPQFPAGTLVLGDSEYVEHWEELEGFLSVEEPNVLGQMVGYAGYADTVVLAPKAFVKATVPVDEPEEP